MLSTQELFANLSYHESIYNNSGQNLRTALLSSKASILEVCGWVEEAMDQIVIDCATRCTLSAPRIASVKKRYIEKTYGFHYENHFEKMLIAVVGYKNLEQIELIAPVNNLQSILRNLTKLRNHYAHTHFDSSNPFPSSLTSIPTPSIMKNDAQIAAASLLALENALKSSGH